MHNSHKTFFRDEGEREDSRKKPQWIQAILSTRPLAQKPSTLSPHIILQIKDMKETITKAQDWNFMSTT